MISAFIPCGPARAAGLLGGTVLCTLLFAPTAGAQADSLLACPDSGVVLLMTDSIGQPIVRDLGSSIDTTYTISVDHRRWMWRHRTARVAAGVRGTEPASWHACAGAWTYFDRATVVVENARGRVYLRASLEPLLEILRRHRSVPREHPGRVNR